MFFIQVCNKLQVQFNWKLNKRVNLFFNKNQFNWKLNKRVNLFFNKNVFQLRVTGVLVQTKYQ